MIASISRRVPRLRPSVRCGCHALLASTLLRLAVRRRCCGTRDHVWLRGRLPPVPSPPPLPRRGKPGSEVPRAVKRIEHKCQIGVSDRPEQTAVSRRGLLADDDRSRVGGVERDGDSPLGPLVGVCYDVKPRRLLAHLAMASAPNLGMISISAAWERTSPTRRASSIEKRIAAPNPRI